MVLRRNYPIVWTDHDFDDLRNELMTRFDRLMTSPLLPPGNFAERIVPTLLGELRVDVAEQENEVIVVADLPGVEKENVEISLVNPRTLEIRCERKQETEEKGDPIIGKRKFFKLWNSVFPHVRIKKYKSCGGKIE